MSSLSPKDRVSLCSFTFADGRRCRTPRSSSHPHFCYYHAQKEARARATDKLGKDLDYFFSGDYLSACDLSTALGRLIPAVLRGEVKPRAARTVAYLAQTLMQAIHISQHEYINAFDTDGWREAICNSVKGNYNYRFPPAPKPEPLKPLRPQPQPAQPAPSVLRTNLRSETPQPPPQPAQPQSSPPQPQQPVEPPVNCHSERSEESASSSNSSLATHHSFTPSAAEGPLPQAPQPALSPHPSLPATSAEFVQQVMAGLHSAGGHVPPPASAPPQPQQPSSASPANPLQPTPVAQPFRSAALPPPVRRRLHRTTTPNHPCPPSAVPPSASHPGYSSPSPTSSGAPHPSAPPAAPGRVN